MVIMKKYLLSIIMCIITGFVAYASNNIIENDYKEAEFPGGYDALYEWVQANVKFPSSALAENISCDVLITVNINAEGNVENSNVWVEGYPEFDYEAYRLMSEMPKWVPATINGKAVSDQKSFALIFNAHSTETDEDYDVQLSIPLFDENMNGIEILTKVAEHNRALIPYAGMNSVNISKIPYLYTDAKFNGGISNLMYWLSENISYPPQAYSQGIEDTVNVKFRINEYGIVDNMSVLGSSHPLLEAEAMRVVGNMPKWKPATYLGKPTVSYFTIPITFKIPPQDTLNLNRSSAVNSQDIS